MPAAPHILRPMLSVHPAVRCPAASSGRAPSIVRRIGLCCALAALGSAVVVAQRPAPGPAGHVVVGTTPAPRPSASATTVKVAPVIDGRLDDEAWRSATLLTGFVQREPRSGEPETERTEVRIVTDGEALYVGFWNYDREATAIVPG